MKKLFFIPLIAAITTTIAAIKIYQPAYEIRYSGNAEPIILFSKATTHNFLPEEDIT